MCYRPLHFHRKSNGYCCYDVPCGKCEECKRSKINGLTARAYQEYLDNDKRAIFVTLTYNDYNLPCIPVFQGFPIAIPLELSAEEGEFLLTPDGNFHRTHKFVSCWNRKHISKFFKSLNQKILLFKANLSGIPRYKYDESGKRYQNPDFSDLLKDIRKPYIKYLLTCERGKKFSQRPHYHAIIYSTDPLITTDLLKQYVRELWTYGYSYNLAISRSHTKAIQYVTKYITKDFNDAVFQYQLPNKQIALNCKPFTCISHGFGIGFLKELLVLDYEARAKRIESGFSIGSDGVNSFSVNYPRYYIDKLTKETVKYDYPTSLRGKTHTDFIHDLSGFTTVIDEHVPSSTTRTETHLTDFGLYLQNISHNNKVDYLLQLYEDFLKHKEFNQTESVFYDLSPVDVAYYFEQVLNIVSDPFINPTIFDRLYLKLMDLKNTRSYFNTLYSQNKYKSSIFEARAKRPDLFTDFLL